MEILDFLEFLLIILAFWLVPVILGVQLGKQYNIRSVRSAEDIVVLFFPCLNWFMLIYCICEALEVWIGENKTK